MPEASPKSELQAGKLRPEARMALRLRSSMPQTVSEGEESNGEEENDNNLIAGKKSHTTQKRIESLTSIYEKVRVS